MNIGVDASELASERLARQLQEEEDCNAALFLQSQLANGIAGIMSQSPVRYIIPDEEADQVMNIVDSDDEEDLFIVDTRPMRNLILSDDDNADIHPISPETQMIVNDALNTAFSSHRRPHMNDDDDVMIVNDNIVIEDDRPPSEPVQSNIPARSQQNRRGTRSSSRLSRNTASQDAENVVLTIGRTSRSSLPMENTPTVGNSLVITNTTRNNSRQSHTYNTRSNAQNQRQTHSSDPGPSSSNSDIEIVNTIENRPNEPSSSGASSSANSSNRPRNNRPRNRNPRGNPRGNHRGDRTNHRTGPAQINIGNNGIHLRNSGLFSRSPNTQVIINGIPIHTGNGMFNPFNIGPNFGAPTQGLIFNNFLDHSMTYEEMIALDDEHTLEPGHGLDKQDIDHNTVTQSYNDTNSNTSKNCNICLNDFVNGEKIRILPCFHSFHVECIDNWLSRKPECPVCRHAVGNN